MMKAVVCKVGNEEFALKIENVISIERIEPVTDIPETPLYVKGMMEYRDQLITVMDLRVWLNKEPNVEEKEEERILIAEYDGKILGLIVDSVTEIIDFKEEDLQETNQITSEKVNEIVNFRNRIVLLLNLDVLFSNIMS